MYQPQLNHTRFRWIHSRNHTPWSTPATMYQTQLNHTRFRWIHSRNHTPWSTPATTPRSPLPQLRLVVHSRNYALTTHEHTISPCILMQ
ncbi:hypothetical protein QL285_014107 [Trifolium repens]|nr:hypothetical protein QL285_014106 [Trifolium repens]KAK2442963.1 hypothetical protein QL285_014107 [Trifolium repens]